MNRNSTKASATETIEAAYHRNAVQSRLIQVFKIYAPKNLVW